jgi:hypothetical protein
MQLEGASMDTIVAGSVVNIYPAGPDLDQSDLLGPSSYLFLNAKPVVVMVWGVGGG